MDVDSHILLLSDEILLSIMSHMTSYDKLSLARTCKRLKKVCFDASNIKSFDLEGAYQFLSKRDDLSFIKKNCNVKQIRKVSFKNCYWIPPRRVETFTTSCTNLTSLNLLGLPSYGFDSAKTNKLLQHLSKLDTLAVQFNFWDSLCKDYDYSDELKYLIPVLNRLKTLHLEYNLSASCRPMAHDRSDGTIFCYTESLESLIVTTHWVSMEVDRRRMRKLLRFDTSDIFYFSCSEKLKILDFDFTDMDSSTSEFLYEVVKTILSDIPNDQLTHLGLHGPSHPLQRLYLSLVQVRSKLTNLQYICLKNEWPHHDMSRDLFTGLIRMNASELRTVRINYANYKTMVEIVKHFDQLQIMNFFHSRWNIGNSVGCIHGGLCDLTANLSKTLQELNMLGTHYLIGEEATGKIGDALCSPPCLNIACAGKHLKKLALPLCFLAKKVESDKDLHEIEQNHDGEVIAEAKLKESENGFAQLVQCCSNLVEFELVNHRFVSKFNVEEKSRTLAEKPLQSCESSLLVEDADIGLIAGWHCLTSLTIAGVPIGTYMKEPLEKILVSCTELVTLSLAYIGKVSSVGHAIENALLKGQCLKLKDFRLEQRSFIKIENILTIMARYHYLERLCIISQNATIPDGVGDYIDKMPNLVVLQLFASNGKDEKILRKRFSNRLAFSLVLRPVPACVDDIYCSLKPRIPQHHIKELTQFSTRVAVGY